ncbi:MAG: trypsin-like peptidase domain-containing protein [Spirochaetaceae bacterium]|nr:trypsin-like peptidase domain-containing protein [Spirochaetaceae bacterium]MCF7949043.1 trypsin-like peptidase domain-containing protein [Spirochaetia bacterium]MCF7951053.1 trypsin-like peptidase domain-containing protein [Spirochaetaceae bacterium]
MKLYSRGQLIFYGISGLSVVLLLLIGFGMLELPWLQNDTRMDIPIDAEIGKEAGKERSAEVETIEEPGFEPKISSDQQLRRVMNRDTTLTDYERNNIDVYQRYNHGVVNITTETLSLNWFLEPVPQEGGTGSGSIIDTRGYILTNYHVVKDAYKVFINLYDGTQYEGQVIGKDSENDLAVVKFDPGDKELVVIPFGDSSSLRVGQLILAIGNPFGYDRTLTSGIVSGLGRPVKTSRNLVIRGMIQTDASINPGNSGGPLLNTNGEMIGINTMIYSPSGGSVGIGFAVPVNTARRVVPQLIEYGKVRRGWIEMVPVQLEPSIVRYGDLSAKKGIMISKVTRGGNADQAGLRGGDQNNPVRYGRSIIYFGGDIIVEVDGMKIATLSDLFSALEDNEPEETVEVVVLRDGRRKPFQVELVERPSELEWD